VVSAQCIDPWILEFVVLNITGNSLWENCILLDFYFRGLNVPRIVLNNHNSLNNRITRLLCLIHHYYNQAHCLEGNKLIITKKWQG
jgi:hypothetical protein